MRGCISPECIVAVPLHTHEVDEDVQQVSFSARGHLQKAQVWVVHSLVESKGQLPGLQNPVEDAERLHVRKIP